MKRFLSFSIDCEAPKIETATAARITQQAENHARETLGQMELELGYLERSGTGRDTYWHLKPDLHPRLSAAGHPERERRIDWKAAKTRVLSVLKQRAERGDQGVSDAEIPLGRVRWAGYGWIGQ